MCVYVYIERETGDIHRYRRLIYKGVMSTHAQESHPGVALGS